MCTSGGSNLSALSFYSLGVLVSEWVCDGIFHWCVCVLWMFVTDNIWFSNIWVFPWYHTFVKLTKSVKNIKHWTEHWWGLNLGPKTTSLIGPWYFCTQCASNNHRFYDLPCTAGFVKMESIWQNKVEIWKRLIVSYILWPGIK